MKKVFIVTFIAFLFVLGAPYINAEGVGGEIPREIVNDNPKQIAGDQEVDKLGSPIKFNTISALLNEVLKVVMRIGVIIAGGFFVYSGFLFVTARGKPKEIGDAKKVFYWTVVGTAVLLGSSGLASIINSTVTQIAQ